MEANQEHTGKGVLLAQAGQDKFTLTRHLPAEDLAYWIQRFWVVAWDLRGLPPYNQVVLSHPNVNLVFERDRTRIYGISPATSSQLLQDQGCVLGVKFTPGGFYPFWKQPVARLAGTSVAFEEVFGPGIRELERSVLEQEDAAAMIARAERFFRERLPKRDPNISLVKRIVDEIMSDRDMNRVDDIVDQFGISKRTLQRLFHRYVGVSPKWVIQRYRLHEAAELIERGEAVDGSKLSASLGYYDQAHFIKDFKAIVGASPEAYARAAERAAEAKA